MNFTVPGDIGLTSDGRMFSREGGTTSLKNRLSVALRTPRGTWSFDLSRGFPWLDVLGGPLDSQLIRAQIVEWLTGWPEITSVDKVDVTIAGRGVSVDLAVSTNQGEIRVTI